MSIADDKTTVSAIVSWLGAYIMLYELPCRAYMVLTWWMCRAVAVGSAAGGRVEHTGQCPICSASARRHRSREHFIRCASFLNANLCLTYSAVMWLDDGSRWLPGPQLSAELHDCSAQWPEASHVIGKIHGAASAPCPALDHLLDAVLHPNLVSPGAEAKARPAAMLQHRRPQDSHSALGQCLKA